MEWKYAKVKNRTSERFDELRDEPRGEWGEERDVSANTRLFDSVFDAQTKSQFQIRRAKNANMVYAFRIQFHSAWCSSVIESVWMGEPQGGLWVWNVEQQVKRRFPVNCLAEAESNEWYTRGWNFPPLWCVQRFMLQKRRLWWAFQPKMQTQTTHKAEHVGFPQLLTLTSHFQLAWLLSCCFLSLIHANSAEPEHIRRKNFFFMRKTYLNRKLWAFAELLKAVFMTQKGWGLDTSKWVNRAAFLCN